MRAVGAAFVSPALQRGVPVSTDPPKSRRDDTRSRIKSKLLRYRHSRRDRTLLQRAAGAPTVPALLPHPRAVGAAFVSPALQRGVRRPQTCRSPVGTAQTRGDPTARSNRPSTISATLAPEAQHSLAPRFSVGYAGQSANESRRDDTINPRIKNMLPRYRYSRRDHSALPPTRAVGAPTVPVLLSQLRAVGAAFVSPALQRGERQHGNQRVP